MPEILEACMIISFGLSWPINIMKSIQTKSTQGKSILFLILIFSGYICGIASKLIGHNITYVFAFYVLNLIMIGADITLYCINYRRESRLKKAATK